MICNICGNDNFIDMKNRKNVKCSECKSLERTRLLYMYLQKLTIKKNHKILHISPEKGIYNKLIKQVDQGNYTVADIDPERYKYAHNCIKIDLCDLDNLPSNYYDLIIHSHVLEHTTCNIAYTLFHLHRMMTLSGLHVCIIPFSPGKYDECFQDISDEERERRFGQHDHVRRFGREDIDLHLGKIMSIPNIFDSTEHFSPDQLRKNNIPEKEWKGFHISTILLLKKYDMKFLQPQPKDWLTILSTAKGAITFKS